MFSRFTVYDVNKQINAGHEFECIYSVNKKVVGYIIKPYIKTFTPKTVTI